MRALLTALILLAPTTAHADDIERRLYPDRIEASSFLWNDWNRFQENYHPNYLADDDRKTAWTEGAKGAGAGEWVRVHLTELEGATRLRLRVRNGYHKSKRLFGRNARAKAATIRLLPSGATHEVTLADKMAWQEVAVDQPSGTLAGFELKIDSVYPGSRYEDLCISDVQVFVTATTPDNPRFERQKRKRLRGWKARRVKAARVFKKSAGKVLPVAAQYKLEELGPAAKAPTCKSDDAPLCRARGALAAARKAWPKQVERLAAADEIVGGQLESWKAVRVAPIDKRSLPEVDGARLAAPYNGQWTDHESFDLPLGSKVGFLRADHLKRVFDDKAGPSDVYAALRAEVSGCRRLDKVKYYAWTPATQSRQGEAAPLRSMFVVGCSKYEERDGEYSVATWQLLMYRDDGPLELMVGPDYVARLSWKGDVIDSVERVSLAAPRAIWRAGGLEAQ